MTPPDDSNKVDTTLITAAVVAVVGVVASLTAAGAMQRVLRNQGVLLAVALGVVAVGGYLLFRAALLPKRRAGVQRHAGWRLLKWWRDAEALRKLGGLVIAVGVLLAVLATVMTARTTERPAISASFDRDTEHLKATITAGDPATDDSINVAVDGLRRIFDDKTDPTRYRYQSTQLAQDSGGPDANGEVNLQIDVAIPAGNYDELGIQAWTRQKPECANVREGSSPKQQHQDKLSQAQQQKTEGAVADRAGNTAGAACVIMPIPVPRPSPTDAWEGTGQDSKSIKITAAAANVRSHVLVVDVSAQTKKKSGHHSTDPVRRLQYHVLGPGAGGQVQTTLRVPIAADTVTVCAEAYVEALPPAQRPDPVCPKPADKLAARDYHGAYAELSR